ncbi:MAG: hypothetical protein C0412_14520 [Flavobacterium sp.]|nr:hypothetical protein [Flavobacterium sp.]
MAKPKQKLQMILLGLLIVFMCVLRLWKATSWFSFNFDEEYQAFLAWSQVLNFHPIWIGVSASNFGFYLGPAFTYLNALLFIISNGDLVSLAIFSPLLGILTSFSIYFIVSKIFSKKAAIFSTLIYGFSTLMNIFDRRFWNPTPIPFITVWLLFSLYKANKDSRWFVLTAVLIAASLHIHLSLIAFWPLVIFVVIRNVKKISLKTWILSVLSYILVVSPLIVFDVNHNYDNLLGPVRYIFTSKQATSSLSPTVVTGNFPIVWRAFSRVWYVRPYTTIQDEMALGVHGNTTPGFWPLSTLSFLILLWLFNKQRKDKNYRLLFFATLSILFAYLVYPGAACEYFLLGFFTLFTIVIGLFLSDLPVKLSIFITGVFIVINSHSVFTINQSKYGLNLRKELIRETITHIKDKPFSVEIVGPEKTEYPQYAGWCFMYRIYGRIPTSCQATSSFGWILNESPSIDTPIYRIVIAEDFKYQSVKEPQLIIQKGAYTIYIFSIQ